MQARAGPRRLLARRGRPAAPRHGQEDPRRDGRAARALRRRRGRARRRAARRPRRSSTARKFADYGFNKSHAAAYALVAYQTAYMKANYPVEFLAASMTLDMGNTDKLAEFRAEAERLGIKVEPPSINRSGVDVRGRGQHHPLRAGGAEGRRRAGGRGDRRGARRPAVPRPRRTSPAASIRARVNKRVLESLARGRRLRRARAQPRARACAAVDAMLAAAQRAHEARDSRTERIVRRRRRRASSCRSRRSSRGCRPNGCSANTTRSASSSPAIRSTTTRRRSSACRCSRWARFLARR